MQSLEYELRVIVEKVAVSSQAVVQRDTLKVYDVKAPQSILELGLRHSEQISLLEKVQNSVLAAQSKLIDPGYRTCPQCGQKLQKRGFAQSKFHAVFTDHQVGIQKHRCGSETCRWQSSPTTTSVFGTTVHPDLAKLQCEQGARHSYREAEQNLANLTVQRRRINNHDRIKQMVDQVGSVLAQENLQPPPPEICAPPTPGLIVQIDGGHIPINIKGKRSFEALSAIVYRPELYRRLDQHHGQLPVKSGAFSAQADDLKTIRQALLNAARKQGIAADATEVVVLADGALNCWSAVEVLRPHCHTLVGILDWFHIGMKFQNVINALDSRFEEPLTRAKWSLWHGKQAEAFTKLEVLMSEVTDDLAQAKLKKLAKFLKNNQAYLVNYSQRKQAGQTFTSQVAESHIESVINARHKSSGKMQWSREGAHNVLQIRGAILTNEWDNRWQPAVLAALGVAA